jgi:V8-like Glu-specific endopeptidase
MAEIDARRIALAVIGNEQLGAPSNELCGTCFAIGEGVFVTAAHVIRCAKSHPVAAVVFVPMGSGTGSTGSMEARIEDYELFDDHDLGLFTCEGGPYDVRSWIRQRVNPLTDTTCFGYPYGLDHQLKRITIRFFRGVISAQHPIEQLTASPDGYELSFPAPRGLSGAPVLATAGLHVLGIVVKNAQSQMLVASDTEIVTEGGERTIVERYEYLTYGIAVGSSAALALKSRLLGCTIEEHLAKHRLLV